MKQSILTHQILKYYKSKGFKPSLPSNSRWRHYRGCTGSNKWVKCKRKIYTAQQLKRWIIQSKLINIYYSTSLWLDPKNISSREDAIKNPSKYILLSANLVFDVDTGHSIKDLKKALKITNQVYHIASPMHEVEAFCFSGNKGFHLSFKYPLNLPKDHRKRVAFLEKKRKVYIAKHITNIDIDKDSTTDVFRIIRVIGTANGKTGLICTQLPNSTLSSKLEDILPHIKSTIGKKVNIPLRITEQEVKEAQITKKSDKEEPKEVISITNQLGKRFTSIIKYPIHQGYKNKLKTLNKVFDIGPQWIFCDELYYYVCGIRTYQKRRLTKLYMYSKSILTKQFKKFHRNYLPIDLKFKEFIDFKTKSLCSRSHYNYYTKVMKYGTKKLDLNFHKETKLKGTRAIYK